jgi:hypothetical protein
LTNFGSRNTLVTDDDHAEERIAMAGITGGCLCGRVRYVATGDPVFSGICHCRNCQRYTGSAFEAFIAMPTASVSTTGELKTFEHPGGSGRPVYRHFCPNCGSGVINVVPHAGLTAVLAGTLDDPAVFAPTMEIWCSSAQPWTQTTGERTKFLEGRCSALVEVRASL